MKYGNSVGMIATNVAESFPVEHLPRQKRRVGAFAERCLAEARVSEIAEKLLIESPLTIAEAEHLANAVALPVLAKLIEVTRAVVPRGVGPLRIRPVISLPVGQILVQDPTSALEKCQQYLANLSEQLAVPGPIALTVDSWVGDFRYQDVLTVLGQLAHFTPNDNSFIPLGPSTVEIKELCQRIQFQGAAPETLRELLGEFQANGVASIEGGCDLVIHEVAGALGFQLSMGQSVEKGIVEASDKQRPINFTRDFIETLFLIRSQLLPLRQVSVWFPWSQQILDRGSFCEDQPLGEQLLRAIALGRLLLPEVPFIRAPLSMLGAKVAHVATQFGANDLGFAAVDSQTAEVLGIARLSEVDKMLGEGV